MISASSTIITTALPFSTKSRLALGSRLGNPSFRLSFPEDKNYATISRFVETHGHSKAEIARHAFQLPDAFAPLPRIFSGHFKGVTIGKLKAAFETKDALSGQDRQLEKRQETQSEKPSPKPELLHP